MTTEQATERLAFIWNYGGSCDAAFAIDRCWQAARDWNWQATMAAMRDAYVALGAPAPEVPLWSVHWGQHPVQIAAIRIRES